MPQRAVASHLEIKMTFAEQLAAKLIRGTVTRGLRYHREYVYPWVTRNLLYDLDSFCRLPDDELLQKVESFYNGLDERQRTIADALFASGGVTYPLS